MATNIKISEDKAEALAAAQRHRDLWTKKPNETAAERLHRLKQLWEHNAPHSMFRNGDLSTKAAVTFEGDARLTAEGVAAGLNYLASVTGDPIFAKAVDALQGYGLTGSLRSAVREMVRQSSTRAYAMLLPLVREKLDLGLADSERDACEQIIAEFGVPVANSFEAAVHALRTRYMEWDRRPAPDIPLADTGRRLRIRLGSELHGSLSGGVIEEGTSFDDHGCGIVPDNRRWRWLIEAGRVVLLGEI